MATLEERVAALEAASAADSAQPTFLTIDPATGKIGANFTGLVHAQGVNLDTAPSIAVPTIDTIRWLSTLPAVLGPGGMTAMLAAWLAPANNPNPTASLSHYLAEAPNGGNSVAVELDAENGGTLSQVYVTANGQSQVLIRGDGATQGAPLLTPAQFPPANPFDGQIIALRADDANGVIWILRYRSGSASASKWEYIGGPSLFAETLAEEQDNQALITYQALATAGPSIAVPVTGDYDVDIGCRAVCAGQSAWMSYDIGATGAVDADGVRAQDNDAANNILGNYARPRRKTGLAAATLTAKYRHTVAGTSAFYGTRWMRVTPVRLG